MLYAISVICNKCNRCIRKHQGGEPIPEERVVSMPRAEQAMPNMWAKVKLTKMHTAMTMQGTIADL